MLHNMITRKCADNMALVTMTNPNGAKFLYILQHLMYYLVIYNVFKFSVEIEEREVISIIYSYSSYSSPWCYIIA